MVSPISRGGRSGMQGPRSADRIRELSIEIAAKSRDIVLRQKECGQHARYFDMLYPSIQKVVTDMAGEKGDTHNFFFNPKNFPGLPGLQEQFSFAWLCLQNTFSEVIEAEQIAGIRWIEEESIGIKDKLAILALTGYGSLFYRTYDADMKSLFYYRRIAERVEFDFPERFAGEFTEGLAFGKGISVITGQGPLITSAAIRLAGMPICGPKDIENANSTFELMKESLKNSNLH